MNEYSNELDFAKQLAREAGTLVRALAKGGVKYQKKNPRDILAEADTKAEALILEKIRVTYPEHGYISEEAGEYRPEATYVWVIDPVDGTINYARNIEEFCIVIALMKDDQVVLSVIYQPVTGKLYTAVRGHGAFLNDKPLSVSSEETMQDAIAATDVTANVQHRKQMLVKLTSIGMQVRHVRIFGSSALHLARIAEGQIDVYFKTSFKYWDFAAGSLLVEEAGGKVTDFEGNPLSPQSTTVLVSNSILHDDLAALVKAS